MRNDSAEQSGVANTERSDFATVELWCRGLAKFLFASSQKCDSPFRGVDRFEFIQTIQANNAAKYCFIANYEQMCRGGKVVPYGVWKKSAERCAYNVRKCRRPNSGRRGRRPLHGLLEHQQCADIAGLKGRTVFAPTKNSSPTGDTIIPHSSLLILQTPPS